jgi:GntR family transcriptional regulator
MAPEDRSDRINPARLEHVWAQVAGDIRADIDKRRLRSGEKLPAEVELAAQYGVARMTVRRAITELVSEGYLVVLRGRGTYVAQASKPAR